MSSNGEQQEITDFDFQQSRKASVSLPNGDER